jgi:hypothetical protein
MLSLAGCATHLVPMDQARAVPKERILAAQATAPTEGSQKFTIVRNAGALFAAGAKVELALDGTPVAALATSEALTLYLQPGEHLLTATVGGLGQVAAAQAITVPSKITIYRINMTDSDIKLQPSIE